MDIAPELAPYEELVGLMRCMENISLVYGEMDIGNGLVRIMIWHHGKIEK